MNGSVARGSLSRMPRRRSTMAVVGGLLVLVAAAGVAYAGTPAETVSSYTGCLTTQGGTLTQLREGDTPAKACPSGSVIAHLSGGDITSITAGTGLTGGGTNGAVTLSLDPKYALRQDCDNGQVVKWDAILKSWDCAEDANTTYTAGAGLTLTGNEFSIDGSTVLPQDCDFGSVATWTHTVGISGTWGCANFAYASQSCASGKVADGVDADGKLTCATAGSGSGSAGMAYTGKEVNPFNGNVRDDHVGMPDDGQYYRFVSLTVPAGTYAVTANGALQSDHQVCSGIGACFFTESPTCQLDGGQDSVDWDEDHFNDSSFNGAFNLVDVQTTSGTTFTLECMADVHEDGLSLHDARIMAIKIG
jgi:hypothetical protein